MVNELLLPALDLKDTIFDGVFDKEAVHRHGPCLPKTVDPIDGLVLTVVSWSMHVHAAIPPAVHHPHVICCRDSVLAL